MNIDYKSLAIGVIGGYLFREAIAQALGGMKKEEAKVTEAAAELSGIHLGALHTNPYGALQMGAIHQNPKHMGALQMGAIHQNPHSAFDQTQAYPHAARGPWGYGALHLGALAHK